jgi:hypothetical protein
VTWTISLPAPVEIDGKTLTELTLREPRIGELLRASGKDATEADATLLAEVVGVPGKSAELAAALRARLFRKAFGKIAPFVKMLGEIETGSLLPPGVKTEDDLPPTLTLALADTIQEGTTWVSKIELHEPTVGDQIKVERSSGLAAVILLVTLCSDQPRAIIERLPLSAFARAAAYCSGFIAGVPQAGRV